MFDISSKNAQVDVPTTNQKTELVTKVVAKMSDFSNLLKSQTPFSIENELAKLKIYITLTKLINKKCVQDSGHESIKHRAKYKYYQPEIFFGPKVDGKPQEGGFPPFYVSLDVHNNILNNTMLDSRTSHNLMPKAVMEKLSLDITRPWKDFIHFILEKLDV